MTDQTEMEEDQLAEAWNRDWKLFAGRPKSQFYFRSAYKAGWQARAALDGGAVSQDEKAEARIRDEMLTDYARIYKYPTPAETVDAFNKYYEDFAAISALERMSHAELEKWFRDRGEDPDEVVQTHKSMIAGAIAAFRTPPQQRDDGAVSRSDVALEELINAASKVFDLLYQFGCSAAADRLDKAIVAARGVAPYFHSLDRSHPAETPTDKLVSDFSVALKSKLNAAREKYGHEDEAWQDTGWKAELLEQLHDHLIKGDPRDVAAYCAFAWYHQWSITPPALDGGAVSRDDYQRGLRDGVAVSRDVLGDLIKASKRYFQCRLDMDRANASNSGGGAFPGGRDRFIANLAAAEEHLIGCQDRAEVALRTPQQQNAEQDLKAIRSVMVLLAEWLWKRWNVKSLGELPMDKVVDEFLSSRQEKRDE